VEGKGKPRGRSGERAEETGGPIRETERDEPRGSERACKRSEKAACKEEEEGEGESTRQRACERSEGGIVDETAGVQKKRGRGRFNETAGAQKKRGRDDEGRDSGRAKEEREGESTRQRARKRREGEGANERRAVKREIRSHTRNAFFSFFSSLTFCLRLIPYTLRSALSMKRWQRVSEERRRKRERKKDGIQRRQTHCVEYYVTSLAE
jgi:hypothetical protein